MEYTPIGLDLGKSVSHLWVKKHNDDEKNAVFIANLPNDTTKDNLRDLCQALGPTAFQDIEPKGHNRALVVLVDKSACDLFLKKAKRLYKHNKAVVWGEYGPRGKEAYRLQNEARFKEEAELLKDANEYMKNYDESLGTKTKGPAVPDENGFTLVKGRKGETPMKKRRTRERSDFYRFQIRERAKQDVGKLLEQYHQDLEKVQELKKRGAFNPYR